MNRILRNSSPWRIFTRTKATQFRNPKSFKLDRNADSSSKVKIKGEILYGHHPIIAALQSNKRLCHTLFVGQNYKEDAILANARNRDMEIMHCDDKILDYLCSRRPHQGICMDVSKLTLDPITELANTDHGLVVYLHQVNDPMNMGAVLRSCAYFGVDRVLLTRRDSCRPSPVVSRASAGALEIIPINTISDPRKFFKNVIDDNWTLVGTDIASPLCTDIKSFRPSRKTVLLLGNEGSGLPSELLELCGTVLYIPSVGRTESLDSLNVSVATGVLLYQISQHLCSE